MLLTIDVGNTETKLGCFDGETLRRTWRVTTQLRRTPDEYGVLFAQLFGSGGVVASEITDVVVASVVPALDAVVETACRNVFAATPVFLAPETQRLIAIATDNPAEVGADLVAVAIGGLERFGTPLIVVSFGTATVFVAISAQGEYLGVAIAPGVSVSIDALIGRTAKLPQVSLEAPNRAIGRNTVDALRSGIIFGFAGQIEAIVARMRAEMAVEARVVATGGLASVVARQTPVIEAIEPHLSLIGLQRFYGAGEARARRLERQG
ncbi:MAG: type III pantothenate kinase [Candidatus Eremiobacteraeota bacterium]|nr:type III pantothenate kinase [Candidatus Eremiobacteraeota bacterium]